VPEDVCAGFKAAIITDPAHFSWVDAGADAEVQLTTGDASRFVGRWTYVLAAPFFTVEDGVAGADLEAAWRGTPAGALQGRTLLVDAAAARPFTAVWGAPDDATVRIVEAEQLLEEAITADAWAILPFEALHSQWKLLSVDGVTPIQAEFAADAYVLSIPLSVQSASRPDALDQLPASLTLSNRDQDAFTRVVMTGVTAMTRATAQLMDAKGVTYPAQDVKPWFEDADFVHVSNEVSFRPDCVAQGTGTMSFCSHDSYIGLLEEINANVIELTGNHLEDKGTEWVDHSLEMYRERGWQWYGGGANVAEGQAPLRIEHGPNKIAFLGCNTVGPFAGETSGGAAPCDFDYLEVTLQQLRGEGYLPIVTLQYLEAYEYAPSPQQIRDFRRLAEAGAVVVQGSQAHQAQTLEFYDGTFIHYGLGNFFFDQMWSLGTRQEFVDQLTFYQGRLLNIKLRTALLEEYGRPRPMNEGERAEFLEMIFALSPGQ
jgi:poly-gamma-glutamate synthesis protein (capsule biosynthesis protein)